MLTDHWPQGARDMLHSPRHNQHAKPRHSNDASHALAKAFRDFVGQFAYPCFGAKAALHRNGLRFLIARDVRSGADDRRILGTLIQHPGNANPFQSVVVLFERGGELSEEQFEGALWSRLQAMAEIDRTLGHAPDSRVASDPENKDFAISFGGAAFFVIGLHPRSSRAARRFAAPGLVFNLHDQFMRLRVDGRYRTLRAAIIDRDRAFSGSVNPMLAEHGTKSAARQYSGRAVGEDWRCPFRAASAPE